jgi:hypothetical protein
MLLLSRVCRWAFAMYNACSRAVVSCSALYAENAREASGQAVFVYGRASKAASLGSLDIYSLALRERVMGLQCKTLLILKQFLSA